MEKFVVSLIISCLSISCTTIHKGRIIKELENYPQVEKIISVEPYTIVDDDEFILTLQLTNNRRLVILIEYSANAVVYLLEIDKFYVEKIAMSRSWVKEKNWNIDRRKGNLHPFLLGYFLSKKNWGNLRDIIDSYDEIVSLFKKILDEGAIPGSVGDSDENWGNEYELKKYTGYLERDWIKIKLYVYTTNDSEKMYYKNLYYTK